MLTARLFLLAAIASVAAADNSVHVHIKVHHNQQLRQAKPVAPDTICLPGYTKVSVEGVQGGFCTKNETCQGFKDNKGNCPGPMPGLDFGSSCGKVKSGAFGCKPNTKPATPPSPPNKPPSPPNTPNKPPSPPNSPNKPPPPPNTPNKPPTLPTTPSKPNAPGKCDPGFTLVSVEGLPGGFCTKREICQGKESKGNCPGPQDGLKFGSYCTTVKSGVFGCKPKTAKQHRKTHSHKKL